MEYNVAPPIPIHNEIEKKIENAGIATFTPANPFAPTPLLIITASITILTDINTIPRTAGIK
ncbi:hypothetical protein BALH_1453 [Bacillus thuringiensis str. Al Hakam]|nr:hypothetical protein BALH_1453 [Bacillus thuringiensis str. Al Hakam]